MQPGFEQKNQRFQGFLAVGLTSPRQNGSPKPLIGGTQTARWTNNDITPDGPEDAFV
jgi:hypothetical protein